jgi:transposase
MVRRKRFITGSSAGPGAASGKAFSARWREQAMRPTGYSSTAAALRFIAAQAAEKGALAHGIGRTKGGRNTKLHAICDEKGRPCVLLLTPGNVHDCKVAQLCIAAMPASAELVADKGYDSQALREWLVERGTEPVIPPRKNRKIQYNYDRAIYKQRNVIERMFCRFKDWRRIATRFDRNVRNFMGAVSLAAAVIWWL